MNFSEALENLERHITITNGAVVDYHLVPKSTAAEDTEEFEVLGDTSVNSTAFSSTTVSRDMSTNSVAHSSDSESCKFYFIIYVIFALQMLYLCIYILFVLFMKLLVGKW